MRPIAPTTRAAVLWTLALGLTACAAEAAPVFVPYEPAPGTPARFAYDQGLTRYLDDAPPSAVTAGAAGVTTFEFDPADGPACMRGGTFRASVREGASDDLVIFLQGGGACWSAFCLAITAAPAGVPSIDLLRPGAANPLDGWDVLYLPYCDGSLFAGDRDVDEDGDGTPDRLHRGLRNLSAALAAGYTRFPWPRRIVLAGSSGGGYGTILAAALVRYVYPAATLVVLDDAGVGIARDGDSAYLDVLLDDLGIRSAIPADCPDCLARGHVTGVVDYLLAHDPDLRFAVISSYDDYVISEIFLQTGAPAFRAALVRETDALHAAYPDRYRRFLYAGAAHTALLGDVSGIVGRDLSAVELPMGALEQLGMLEIESLRTLAVGDVRVADWIRGLAEGDLSRWVDVTEDPGP